MSNVQAAQTLPQCAIREQTADVSPRSLEAANFAGEEMSVNGANFGCIRELLQCYARLCYSEETTHIKRQME